MDTGASAAAAQQQRRCAAGEVGVGGVVAGGEGGLSDNNAQLLSVVFNAMCAFYTGPSHLCLELPR